jgi:hypothetical protein
MINEQMKLSLCKLTKHILLLLSGILIFSTSSVPDSNADGSFFIERPKLGLGTSYKYEEEKRSLSDIETKTTSHDLREHMNIRTGGWLYHPNLMKYNLSFEPEWRQERFRYSQSALDYTKSNHRDTSVLSYDAQTQFLKEKPCSLDIFANRSDRQIDLSYTQDTDIESETWGSRLNYKNSVLPISVGFINKQTSQDGFYNSDEDRNEIKLRIKHNLKQSSSELFIIRDDTEKTTRTDFDAINVESNTTNTEFTNTYFFTGDERIRLDSFLYLSQAEYNDVQMDTRLVTENLFWSHSENLLTQYTANYNQCDVNDVETEEKAIRGLLTHHLGDILTTNFGAGVALIDFVGGGEDSYQSELGIIFRRPVPWGGIELGVIYDYEVNKRNGEGKEIPTESKLTLSSGDETFLKAEDIIIESIVVTDVTGTIVYTENIDYRIFQAGSYVQISRSLLGDISEGQEVVVRYSYSINTDYDDSRFGQKYRLDLELGPSVYLTYNYNRMDQSILSGDSPVYLMDNASHVVRFRYEVGRSETRLEYEKQDRKNGNSFVTKSVGELIKFRMFRSLYLNFSGNYGRRNFTDLQEDETFYTIGTDIGWTPKWWCTLSLISQRSIISGDLQDMVYSEISPKIRLSYGVWTASLAYRVSDQEDRDFDNSLYRNRIYCIVNRALW